jgi:hypothetical protein
MPTSRDQRAQMVPKMEEYEKALLKELVATQVTKIDLAEYAPGSERVERLYEAIAQANRFTWPSFMRENV